MDFQNQELQRILPEHGWEIEVLDNYDFHPWSRETWFLKSFWSPVEAKAYAAFLIDPMDYVGKPYEKQSVWAIGLYDWPPHRGVKAVYEMTLNHFKEELPGFLEALQRIRAND